MDPLIRLENEGVAAAPVGCAGVVAWGLDEVEGAEEIGVGCWLVLGEQASITVRTASSPNCLNMSNPPIYLYSLKEMVSQGHTCNKASTAIFRNIRRETNVNDDF